jgi:hypothetical protein
LGPRSACARLLPGGAGIAADVRSVWRLAACVATLLAAAGGGAAVASGVAAVLGRSRPVVRGGSPRGASCLGLIAVERVADRRAEVALPGRFVAALGRAVSGVGVPIGLIAVVGCGHARVPRPRGRHGDRVGDPGQS